MRKDRTSATEADSAAAADGDGCSPERCGILRLRLSGCGDGGSPVRRLSNSPGLKNLKQVAIQNEIHLEQLKKNKDEEFRKMRELERQMQEVLNHVFKGRFQLFMEGNPAGAL